MKPLCLVLILICAGVFKHCPWNLAWEIAITWLVWSDESPAHTWARPKNLYHRGKLALADYLRERKQR